MKLTEQEKQIRIGIHESSEIVHQVNLILNSKFKYNSDNDSYFNSKYGELEEYSEPAELIHGRSDDYSFKVSITKMKNSLCEKFVIWFGNGNPKIGKIRVDNAFILQQESILQTILNGKYIPEQCKYGKYGTCDGYRILLQDVMHI